jgi:hypothetical protein
MLNFFFHCKSAKPLDCNLLQVMKTANGSNKATTLRLKIIRTL